MGVPPPSSGLLLCLGVEVKGVPISDANMDVSPEEVSEVVWTSGPRFKVCWRSAFISGREELPVCSGKVMTRPFPSPVWSERGVGSSCLG